MKDNDIFREHRNLGHKDIKKSFFTIGYQKADFVNDINFPFHFHDWYEFYYLKDGMCNYTIGNKKYTLAAGSWILVAPDQKHKIFYGDIPHERIIIYFSRDYMSSVMIDKMKFFTANPVYVACDEDRDAMEMIVGRLIKEFESPDEFSSQIYKNLIFELMLYYMRKPLSFGNKVDADMIIDHVMDHIHRNYRGDITLEELAEINNVSKSYMSRKFKKVTGMNVMEYIRYVRVKHAKILLVETTHSISEVSEKCGFNDSNYFSYVFKQQEGISPLKYRKMYLK